MAWRSGWYWQQAHWLWLSAVILGLDQWTKLWVMETLWRGQRVPVVPGILDLFYTTNSGAAFSFLANAGGWQRPFLTTVALLVSAVLLVWLVRLPRSARLLPLSLSLVLAGAVGNVLDRIQYGYVIDFILVYWHGWFFPAFNVADMAISCGAVLLLVDAFWPGRHRSTS
jgi:signal peptidase II